MDKRKEKNQKTDFSWLPERMPGVARMVREKRAKHGDYWVNECWKRGVVCLEPGWFYAAEGPLAIGVLWDDPQIIAFAAGRITRTQALVVMREPGTKGQAPIETPAPGAA
jgi:hypothetical protein